VFKLKSYKPPFILRELRTDGGAVEIIGDFPFMLSLVEAFLGFSAESFDCLYSSDPLSISADQVTAKQK
jgi:hypothetical protein